MMVPKLKLIPGAYRLFLRLWSIRITLFWGAICGLYSAWGAFQDLVPPVPFALVSMGMMAAIAGARVTKQKGID